MSQPLKNTLMPLDLGPETISGRLQNLRKHKGLTQWEVAERVGVTREAVAAYESGRVRLSDEMLARFSIVLNVSADQILGLSGQPVEDQSSIRIMKRVRLIEKLPLQKQKAILQTIDGFLKGEGF